MVTSRRLHLLVEGQTEETIVSTTLAPYLEALGWYVGCSIVKTKRPASGPAHRGGVTCWAHIERDVRLLLRDSSIAVLTTLVDYYAFPSDAPGMSDRPGGDVVEKVEHVERAIKAAIGDERFLPNLVVHETEAWVLAAYDQLGSLYGDPGLARRLRLEVDKAGGPELVNDGPSTAPSKRLLGIDPTTSRRCTVRLPSTISGCPRFAHNARTWTNGSQGSKRASARSNIMASGGGLGIVGLAMSAIIDALIGVASFGVVYLASSMRVVQQYERGLVFRLGRVVSAPRQPGLVSIVPIVDRMRKVNMQIITLPVPAQEGITRDNVTVKVDAVVYFNVIDPVQAIVHVQDYRFAVLQVAQTSLRSIIGKSELDDLLSNRERLNQGLELMIDSPAVGWGVHIDRVEIKDVALPETMKRSMSRQAEAERERRARVISADGELQASYKLSQAAATMADTPAALQLRLLETVVEVAAEKNSTLVLPFPVELLRFLEQAPRTQAQSDAVAALMAKAANGAVPAPRSDDEAADQVEHRGEQQPHGQTGGDHAQEDRD